MTATRTLYQKLAEVLANSSLPYTPAVRYAILVDQISTVLKQDNPNFSRERFTSAAYRVTNED